MTVATTVIWSLFLIFIGWILGYTFCDMRHKPGCQHEWKEIDCHPKRVDQGSIYWFAEEVTYYCPKCKKLKTEYHDGKLSEPPKGFPKNPPAADETVLAHKL